MIKEEIKSEIKQYLESNKSKNIKYKCQRMQQKNSPRKITQINHCILKE
jgi:hypothetical protein